MKKILYKLFGPGTLWRTWLLAIVIILYSGLNHSVSAGQKTLRIIVTSDLHGWFSSTLLYPNRKPFGIHHLKPLIDQLRQSHPDLLLLDTGDLLSGSPLSAYSLSRSGSWPRSFLNEFQQLGYDAVVPGNHDLEVFSGGVDSEFIKGFPWIGLNLGKGCPQIPSWKLLYSKNHKIAVMGITTPDSQSDVQKCKAVDFRDGIQEIFQEWELKVKPDLKVALLHTGIHPNRNLQKVKLGNRYELPSGLMIRDFIPQFDLVFSGHDHRYSPSPSSEKISTIEGVPVFETGFWGKKLLVVDFDINKKKANAKVDFKWKFYQPDSKSGQDIMDFNLLPQDYIDYINASTGWRRETKQRVQFQKKMNQQLKSALLEQAQECVFYHSLKLKQRDVLPGEAVRRRHIFHWIPYQNTYSEILVSQRGLQMLGNTKNYQLVCKQKKANVMPSKWFTRESEYRLKHPVLVSSYLLRGGSGILLQIPFRKIQAKKKGNNLTGSELLFRKLNQEALKKSWLVNN